MNANTKLVLNFADGMDNTKDDGIYIFSITVGFSKKDISRTVYKNSECDIEFDEEIACWRDGMNRSKCNGATWMDIAEGHYGVNFDKFTDTSVEYSEEAEKSPEL